MKNIYISAIAILLSGGLALAESPAAVTQVGAFEWDTTESTNVAVALARIPLRINELALVTLTQHKADWTAYYKRRNPGEELPERTSVAVRVQSYDSVDAAEQGVKTSITQTSVMWTRQEDFRGTRLYVWDNTMGSPRILFRLDNDVINIDLLEKTASRDFLRTVLEVVCDELKTAGQ